MTYGNNVIQSFAGGAGLDRYSRVTDLHFTHQSAVSPPVPGTIQRYQYGYDAADNPLFLQAIDKAEHSWMSAAYEQAWAKFILDNPQATWNQIVDFARGLMSTWNYSTPF